MSEERAALACYWVQEHLYTFDQALKTIGMPIELRCHLENVFAKPNYKPSDVWRPHLAVQAQEWLDKHVINTADGVEWLRPRSSAFPYLLVCETNLSAYAQALNPEEEDG